MSDFHIHSFFSPDSEERLEKIVEKAVEKKLKAIAITDHIELGHGEDYTGIVNFELFFDTIQSIRIMNPKLYIAIGAEVGYTKTGEAMITQLVKKYPFDYVINSVHTDCENPELYLKSVLESINAPFYYSSIGHLGVCARYNPAFNFDDHTQIIYEILTSIIKKDKILEVNTDALHTRYQLLPSIEVLKTYKKLGGSLITLGSDAHRAANIARGFDRAKLILKEIGFKELSIEKSRKREQLPL